MEKNVNLATDYKAEKITAQGAWYPGLGSIAKSANLTSKINYYDNMAPDRSFNGHEKVYNLIMAIKALSNRDYTGYYDEEKYSFMTGE